LYFGHTLRDERDIPDKDIMISKTIGTRQDTEEDTEEDELKT